MSLMSNWRRLVPAALLLVSSFVLTACPKGTTHKAREAVADIASGLQAVQSVNEQLYHSKMVTPQEGQAISDYVVQATYLNDHAHACVTGLSSDVRAIANCVAPFVDQMKTAEAAAVLKIGNPKARLKFETALRGIDAGMAILQAVLAQ